MPKTSSVIELHTILAMLDKGHGLVSASRGWDYGREKPYRMLIRVLQDELRADRNNLGPDFLTAFADWSCDPVNQALISANFPDIQLPDLGIGIYMASVAKTAKRLYHEAGQDQLIAIGGNQYPGFQLLNEEHGVRFIKAPFTSDPIISVPTQSGWRMLIVPLAEKPEDMLKLWTLAVTLMSSGKMHEAQHAYEGVVIPCVNLDIKPDIKEFEGMSLLGTAFGIRVAMQEIRVVINRFGFSAEAAASAKASESFCRQRNCYVIGQPYGCCFVAGNESHLPLFPAWYGLDSFKDGDLI